MAANVTAWIVMAVDLLDRDLAHEVNHRTDNHPIVRKLMDSFLVKIYIFRTKHTILYCTVLFNGAQ